MCGLISLFRWELRKDKPFLYMQLRRHEEQVRHSPEAYGKIHNLSIYIQLPQWEAEYSRLLVFLNLQ